MKKENKLWLPLVIVLAILVVGLFVASIIVKVTIGKHEVKKGTGEVVEVEYDDDNSVSYDAVEGDDFSYEAEVNVTIVPALENPKAYIIKQNPWYDFLTENDLKGLTAEELYYAYYEVYAREGVTFDDPTVQAYFNGKTWYYNYSSVTVASVNDLFQKYPNNYSYKYAIANLALIQKYVTDNNLTYTP